ncbi:MAG: family 43 glycosylhydrolase [Lachnospiraceae bacterium]|nr:family 43 glycosylhydrolase [Lachnospiraceae bacterium]
MFNFKCFKKLAAITLAASMAVSSVYMPGLTSRAYTNPYDDANALAWEDYGIGDPFVMKYNGLYYLYYSTKDRQVGVQCLVSKDLVHWEKAGENGFCSTEEITKGAYAPEVKYYNGKFYMYTSPAGQGHFVLVSDSPTGPFVKASENFKMSIDGSVFVDNDGKWYFYNASDYGIIAHEMSSPTAVNTAEIRTGAWMNSINAPSNTYTPGVWTEGPFVIYHNGKYYMTYTGNHIHSQGYRINYSIGDTPTAFHDLSEGPLLVETEGDVTALGHSSTVMGPDLDSYYIVYHNLVDKRGSKRKMNIDQLVFNGDEMMVLGPTTWGQTDPKLPEICEYFGTDYDAGKWTVKNGAVDKGFVDLSLEGSILSKASTTEDYSVEYNMTNTDTNGTFGGYFGYKDSKNYGFVGLNKDTSELEVNLVVKGKSTELRKALPKSFGKNLDLSKNQTVRVAKSGNNYEFFVNDMLMEAQEITGLGAGRVGYWANSASGKGGFIAASSESMDSSAYAVEQPVPGAFPARDYAQGSGNGISHGKKARQQLLKAGDFLTYNLNVKEDGVYDVSFMGNATAGTKVTLKADNTGVNQTPFDMAAASGNTTTSASQTASYIYRGIRLTKGIHTFSVNVAAGELMVEKLTFAKEAEKFEGYTVDYSKDTDLNGAYTDDSKLAESAKVFKLEDEKLSTGDNTTGKILYGSEEDGDCEIEADVTVKTASGKAGILFKSQNASVGGADNDAVVGRNFVQGYLAGVDNGKITLAKLNYNYKTLASKSFSVQDNQTIHLKVITKKDRITVFANGEEVISYVDSNPFLSGRSGFRTDSTNASFDNLTVTPIVSEERKELDKPQVTPTGTPTICPTPTPARTVAPTPTPAKKVTVGTSKITKVTVKKGKASVTLKKISGATKYKIVYANNKKFKKSKTYTTKKTSKISFKVKGLKKGNTAYFKVFAQKTVKGKTYTGKASAVKKVKVK